MRFDGKTIIILDTNFLYVNYKNRANFCEFKFNEDFNLLIDYIEKNNLEDSCVIGLSQLVLEELLGQLREMYLEKKDLVYKNVSNFIFPDISFSVSEVEDFKYEDYIRENMINYISKISSKVIDYINVPLPDSDFDKIMDRAFKKKPPFEGKNGKGDKGFKDSLLWHSIIQYNFTDDVKNVLLCTRDDIFNMSCLKREFNDINHNIYFEVVKKDRLYEVIDLLAEKNGFIYSDSDLGKGIYSYLYNNENWKTDIEIDSYFIDEIKVYSVEGYSIDEIYEVSHNVYEVLVTMDLVVLFYDERTENVKEQHVVKLKYNNEKWELI